MNAWCLYTPFILHYVHHLYVQYYTAMPKCTLLMHVYMLFICTNISCTHKTPTLAHSHIPHACMHNHTHHTRARASIHTYTYICTNTNTKSTVRDNKHYCSQVHYVDQTTRNVLLYRKCILNTKQAKDLQYVIRIIS